MLNPSTADAFVDDPTIRRCMSFSRLWGFGSLQVVNLYAFRSSDPGELLRRDERGEDVVGPDNARMLASVCRPSEPIVLAWGATKLTERARALVAGVFTSVPDDLLLCLGVTQGGGPRHPLYLKGDTPRVEARGRVNYLQPFRGA